MNKRTRLEIYQKYSGHCAYCGKGIELRDMQVDHIEPLRRYADKKIADRIENLNPSCRRCNHYKRTASIEVFRRMLQTLHERIRKNYICKVAEDYGVIAVKKFDGVFYFEKMAEQNGGGQDDTKV